MGDLVSDGSARLALAARAVELIVNGTPEESGDLVWAMVQRGKRQWDAAGLLAGRLGLSQDDVLSVMRAVDEASRDGHGASWVVRWVDARRLNAHGPETTARVVTECAAALGVTLPPEVEP
ncbi:MAG: hypothetical protein K0Q93_3036 [Nocardioidaceae bacterium]|jgi:hypothetical protein|nr:hypothetical protein [Nocardioidaceae bacterium]